MEELQNRLRAIPAIDRLLTEAGEREVLAAAPHGLVARVLRVVVDAVRSDIKNGKLRDTSAAALVDQAEAMLKKETEPKLRRAINATGVVLHTNLGRAPLSRRALDRMNEIAAGYSTLEYDTEKGERGNRHSHVTARICELTGAEDALVVNNNAAAVLLALSSLARGREVIVSRGQLVEIGGSFRIPEVLEQSGALMIEVGTTNKTSIRDYEKAIGANTAALLKVHTSNYRIVGFTAQPTDEELVDLARRHNIPLIEDLGSGALLPQEAGPWEEPTVKDRLSAGIDVVTFSGDKLLGGAQAGFIAGKKALLQHMACHPLMRAVRIDKLSLAATEGTLLDYMLGTAIKEIPTQRMLHTSLAELKKRAERLSGSIGQSGAKLRTEVVPIDSQAGGGTLPAVDFASFGVRLRMAGVSASELERKLRTGAVPVIARVQDDSVILDVRCLTEDDMGEVGKIVALFGEEA